MNPILIAALLALPPLTDPPMLAVKTNIPPWGMTVMNIEPELYFSPSLSVSLPLYWCPWFIGEKKALRVFASQPELRFRFRRKPTGHYIGIHGSLAWFNIRFDSYRYQDVGRPLLGAGLSYGYVFQLSSHWIADVSIGAGYASMRYDRFYNTENGARVDMRRTSYWGIDKFSLSIGYIIDL
ncbi:MAG: DUF3575 domain-containing protein [Muribaculaceae bacterium]|nr:DUF3575 domain-containing protein [Muribaculaceae bacterium]MDE7110247.1 DUF3575 domain-containing protein [Muribaculaceae bacterium]